jgi:squalene synthase HpnC
MALEAPRVAALQASSPAGPVLTNRGAERGADRVREKQAAENFPVALRVLPAELREDLGAVYAVVRTIDDLGDEGPGDRTAALEAFADDLRALWAGRGARSPVLARLSPTVAAHGMSLDPFLALVQANLQDQRVSTYATYEDLRGYCTLSAEPVGRMVLEVFGAATPRTEELSDRVCAALQLLEHWQDVAEDRRAGRTYLPQEDLTAFGVPDGDLDAPRSSPAVRALLAFETDRAAALLAEGAAVVGLLHGWARVAVAGYVAGGSATVDALRRPGTDVLRSAPRPRRADLFRHLALTLRGRP